MAKAVTKAAPAKKAAAPVEEMTVYEALMGALAHDETDCPAQTAKETEQDYLTRLLNLVANVSDDAWNTLDESMQEWFNTAIKRMNAEEKIPSCPGYVAPAKKGAKAAPVVEEEPEEEAPAPRARVKAKAAPEPEPEEELEEEAPAPVAKKKIAAVPAKAAPVPVKGKAKAAPVEEEEVEEKPAKKAFGGKQAAPFTAKPDGVTYQIRLAIAKNPDIEAAALKTQISKKFPDVKSATITTLLGDVKATIRAVKAAGHWND